MATIRVEDCRSPGDKLRDFIKDATEYGWTARSKLVDLSLICAEVRRLEDEHGDVIVAAIVRASDISKNHGRELLAGNHELHWGTTDWLEQSLGKNGDCGGHLGLNRHGAVITKLSPVLLQREAQI